MMPGQVGGSSFPSGGLEPAMSAAELAEQKFSALMAALMAGAVAPAMTPVEPDLPVLLPETPPTMAEAPPIEPTPSPVTTTGMEPVDPSQIVEDKAPIEPPVGSSSEGEAPSGLTTAPAGDLPVLLYAAYAAIAQMRAITASHSSPSASPTTPTPESETPSGPPVPANAAHMSLSRGHATKMAPSATPPELPGEAVAESPGAVALQGLESLVEELDIGSSTTVRRLSVAPQPEPAAPTAQHTGALPLTEASSPETVAPKAMHEAAYRLTMETERTAARPHRETTATVAAEASLYGSKMPAAADGGSLPEPVEVRPAPMAQETSRPPTATDRVTLHLPDEAGGTRIQIAVRGETVHTRIVASNPAAAGNLEHGVGDLRDALARQGFQEQQVRVETRAPVAEPRAAVEAGWAPAAARDSAGASNERRQESDPREDARRPDPREQQQHRSPNRDRRGRER
jgi:flagellar hook-length control protein FliK